MIDWFIYILSQALGYCKIRSSGIVNCHGITRFPENGNYAMVLNHILDGNLREYLQKNHSKLTLKDRIIIFNCICESLDDIHEKDLIHCDLHSGNIVVHTSGACYITDLGLCGPVDDESSNKIYGIVPYIAPELFCGKKNTKETDVYSVGMLMWEIFAGNPPFDDRAHDKNMILDILLNGARPPILPEIPDDYAQMMQKCWDMDPSKRPTIRELYRFSHKKLGESYKTKNLDNNSNSSGYISGGSNSNSNNNSQQVHKSHPLAYHTSRILEDEIAKLNLKSNDSLLSDLDASSFIDSRLK